MPRQRTPHVEEVKTRLIARLRDGFFRPGDRFMSNRAIASRFGISYQTAHRLVSELAQSGLLVRRNASGTYLPGRAATLLGVQLVFHWRARRAGSFGHRLFREITTRLDRERIAWKPAWFDPASARSPLLSDKHLPVIWECPPALAAISAGRRRALLLNDRPASGIDSVYIDSVSTDDFSGGALAAQLLLQRVRPGRSRFLVLAGPPDDPRSRARVAGFLSILRAETIHAGGWYLEDGLKLASRVLAREPAGIFCCNDRLAQAILSVCDAQQKPRVPIVGFDNAPIAEQLHLTTIAIPWEELAAGAIAVLRKRLAGDPATASHQIFAPRPILRWA